MEPTTKWNSSLFIVLEIALGVILSLIFLKYATNNNEDVFWGKTIADGIIKVYGTLSLIFFFSVFLIGIIGAIKLKQTDKIGKAILYSILFWSVGLIVSVFLSLLAVIPSFYVILLGIVVGFNIGLGSSKKTNPEGLEQ